MDYGKYCTTGKARARSQEAPAPDCGQEVKFRINVDDHDYDTKKNHVLRFLRRRQGEGHHLFPRSRDDPPKLDAELDRLIQDLGDKAIVEFRPRQEGNTLH